MELIFHYGDAFKKYTGEREASVQPRSFLHGQLNRFMDVEATGKIGVFSIRFAPSGLRRFVNMNIDELTCNAIDVEDLWGKEGRMLEERIMTAPTAISRMKIVEDFLSKRMTACETRLHAIDYCIRNMVLSSEPTSIDRLAAEVNLSRRELERKFQNIVGLSPKRFLRITRFQQVLKYLEQNPSKSFTTTAYANGYFDQSHFIKDFKEFTGFSPTQYFYHRPELAQHLIS
jgi:AraC-like DNA-binding protein